MIVVSFIIVIVVIIVVIIVNVRDFVICVC